MRTLKAAGTMSATQTATAVGVSRRTLFRMLAEGGDDWVTIRWAEVHGDTVLIDVEDGTTYLVDYIDAMRCRPPGG